MSDRVADFLIRLAEDETVRAAYAARPDTVVDAQGFTPEEAAERHASEYALKRVTHDADVANACLFLASDVSRQITGVDLPVDGGWAML